MTTTSQGYRTQVEAWNALSRHGASECLTRVLSALLAAPPYADATRQLLTDDVMKGASKLTALLQLATQGKPVSLLSLLHDYGVALARSGVEVPDVLGLSTSIRRGLSPALRSASYDNPDVTFALIDSVTEAVELGVRVVAQAYSAAQKQSGGGARYGFRTTAPASLSWDLHFSALYEQGIIGINICDTAGNILDANESFLKMLGYSIEEVHSGQLRWTDLTPLEWHPLDLLAIEQLNLDRETPPWEKEFFHKDGSRVPVLVGVAALNGSNVSVDGSIVCVAFVINLSQSHRFVERTTQALKAALQISQVRFKRLFESGIVGILICDIHGNIREANDYFLNLIGYPLEDFLSGRVRWSDLTPPEWRDFDEVAIEQLKAKGSGQIWEKEYVRKDGTRLPILIGVASLGGADCIAFILDITERKRAEALRIRSAELEAQNKRVQESSRMKSQFLANMSHELRTPLNAIIGFADLLYEGEIQPSSPQHHELLGDIVRSSKHLLQLINDILDLAKVESGKFEFYPEHIDVAELLNSTVSTLNVLASNKQIHLYTEADPQVDFIKLDATRLKQVLYNYISNAIKFTEPNGHVAVRIYRETDSSFRLEVEDTGTGIAPHDLPRLFGEFEQLDGSPSKKHHGTGLGLALTKRIVEAQGGTVGVTSTLGKGSVFFAILPYECSRLESPDNPDAGKQDDLTPPTSTEAPRALVVDDIVSDRQLITRILRGAGYLVDEATTAQQAIDACFEHTYNIITLDLLLPDQTGLAALHRIRTAGKNLTTPTIVISIVAEQGLVEGYFVQDYISKPINSTRLLSSIKLARTPKTSTLSPKSP